MANHAKHSTEQEGPGQDPAFIHQCMEALLASKAEFPIKVEGTHTLPYASQVQAIEREKGLVLKLIRPLPHELASGALFEMVFSAGEQRWQGLVTFLKRDAYLTYRFTVPAALTLSDRRRHKRYPFRPREMVDVLAQDGTVPGHGMAGPLVNLSQGGIAFRVDRLVRLDSGLRIPVSTAMFERGRALPLLRIRNLPKAPLLEARGSVAHVVEVGGQVQLGVEFGDLTAENGGLLRMVLGIRETAFRASPAPAAAAERRPPRAPADTGATAAAAPAPAADPGADGTVLRALQRRCRTLALVADPDDAPRSLAARLDQAGYLRLWSFSTAAGLRDQLDSGTFASPDAVIVQLAAAPGTLQAVRLSQENLGEHQKLPTLFLARDPDPLASLAEEPGWTVLSAPAEEEDGWLEVLDRLVGIG